LELVYLWVDEYKNIKNQGFNFSPKFDCSFDGKELTINPKEHIENLFGENINITAIVGENESGKSNIISILQDILFENIYNKRYPNKNFNYLLCYKIDGDNKNLYKCTNIKFEDKNLSINGCTLTKKCSKKLLKQYTDTISLYLNNEPSKFNTFSKRNAYFESQQEIIHIPHYKLNDRTLITIENYLKNKYNFFKYNENFFTLDKITIAFNGGNFSPYTSLTQDIEYFEKKHRDYILNEYQNFDNYTFYEKLEKLYKIFEVKKNYNNAENTMISFTKDKKKSYFENTYNLNESFIDLIPEKIRNSDSLDLKFEFTLSELTNSLLEFLKLLPNSVISVEISNKKGVYLSQLSYGEKQILTQLHVILHYINKVKYELLHEPIYKRNETIDEYYSSEHVRKVILFIDEFELGLHPNWQKNVILYLISFLKEVNIKFHLFITTHSPFLLSDLPKENIIFLKKDKETGNCINVSKQIDIKPFGANIHTLLSDGFFMDGLMGEFAKEKIKEIMNFLSKDEKLTTIKENQVKNIIESIGENFLKEKLLFMYSKKFPSSNEDRIKQLEAEIERLKNDSN